MARNMIEANSAIFAKLAVAGGDLITNELKSQKRAIETDPAEKRWAKNLVIGSSPYLRLDATTRFAVGKMEGQKYLFSIGLKILNPPLDLQPVDLNAGMFTVAVYELDVPIRRTADLEQQLLQHIFYPCEGRVELIPLDVVIPFFQEVHVYRIDPASALEKEESLGLRAAIAAVVGTPEMRPLDWPTSALERFAFMARDEGERAPFHLLLRALTEVRDEAAFLALYRCIEQLFPLPQMSSLSAELGLSQSAMSISAIVEKHLKWRRPEEAAIVQLFTELESTLIQRLVSICGTTPSLENPSKPVAKRVYEIRNQCVHYRPAHAVGVPQPVENWLALADLMLEVVQSLYLKYAIAFSDSPASTVDSQGSQAAT